MRVNSKLRWRVTESCSWLRCLISDVLRTIGAWLVGVSLSIGRWFVCVFTHRGAWTRQPVYHSWSYTCGTCGRRWTTPD